MRSAISSGVPFQKFLRFASFQIWYDGDAALVAGGDLGDPGVPGLEVLRRAGGTGLRVVVGADLLGVPLGRGAEHHQDVGHALGLGVLEDALEVVPLVDAGLELDLRPRGAVVPQAQRAERGRRPGARLGALDVHAHERRLARRVGRRRRRRGRRRRARGRGVRSRRTSRPSCQRGDGSHGGGDRYELAAVPNHCGMLPIVTVRPRGRPARTGSSASHVTRRIRRHRECT